MWGHKTGVFSSNPTRATIKTPLVRNATGNHLIKSTSLENTKMPTSGFCYALYTRHAPSDFVNLPPSGDSPILRLAKFCQQCNYAKIKAMNGRFLYFYETLCHHMKPNFVVLIFIN